MHIIGQGLAIMTLKENIGHYTPCVTSPTCWWRIWTDMQNCGVGRLFSPDLKGWLINDVIGLSMTGLKMDSEKSEKIIEKCYPKSKKGNKMEAVIRIFRITAGLIVGPSYSDQETVTALQTMYKHQDWLIAPKMLYLFPVTGILPQTVVSNSGYPVPACAGGCETSRLKWGAKNTDGGQKGVHAMCKW